ncbi:MAG TPA: glycosyltransferase [Solirubrobacter sp.]|nr:glycosyltransferase [Solirubrobacter sp.]
MPAIPKTLFIGWGVSIVSYYRAFLPAVALGADYVAWASNAEADDIWLATGLGARPPRLDELFDYEVVVIQQPRGVRWTKLIHELRAAGVTVLYEIDDYIQSARKIKTHELSGVYDAEFVREMEMPMRVTDGIVCSTDYLARRYRAFNERTWACYNGIDLKRYAWPRPAREGVTIGWAGGVGHKASLARWEPALRAVLRARDQVRFVSVGHGAAAVYHEEFGTERAIGLPATKIETYPASMTVFDIAIAPSAENNLFRGKSDLRWLEASALSLPLVAHPDVYPEIEDGVTGVHARTPAEAEAALLELVDDRERRDRIGRQAYEYVAEHRRIEVAAQRWRDVLCEVAPARV